MLFLTMLLIQCHSQIHFSFHKWTNHECPCYMLWSIPFHVFNVLLTLLWPLNDHLIHTPLSDHSYPPAPSCPSNLADHSPSISLSWWLQLFIRKRALAETVPWKNLKLCSNNLPCFWKCRKNRIVMD